MPSRIKAIPKRSRIAVKVGATIRVSRVEAGHTQERLAELAALSKNYIGSVERGEYDLTLPALDRVAGGLRCKASDLLRAAGY